MSAYYKGWKAYAQWEGVWAGYKLHLVYEDMEQRSVVTTLGLKTIDRHAYIAEPSIPHDQAENFMQAIMDAAWEAGMRPRGFKDHANELTAVRYHLEDMRSLAGVKGEPR